MASEISLPELGENVEGGVVVEVYVSAGDQIKERQPLMEVEAGKGTVEVPAPFAGKVLEVLVKKGDDVETGQALLRNVHVQQPELDAQLAQQVAATGGLRGEIEHRPSIAGAAESRHPGGPRNGSGPSAVQARW